MGCAVPPPRPVAGQASAEYVALLAVVCAVVAGAAAVGSVPGLASGVVGAIRHGVCRVAGGICTAGEARAAGLDPCLVAARTERERLAMRVLVVRVGRDDVLLVQRRSDGSAAVSFADGRAAGVSAGLGLQFAGRGASARGSAGLQFTSGETWEFASVAQAVRFARRWAGSESLGGELRGLVPGGDERPKADSRYEEGGAYGEVAGALGGDLGAEAHAEGRVVMGRRIERGGRVTYYDRIGAETGGHLGLLLGTLERHDAGELALEVTTVHGRATELRVRGALRVHGDLSPPASATTLGDLVSILRSEPPEPGGSGRRIEAEVSLDLTDPANRRALAGFLEIAALRVPPSAWGVRVRALAHRLDVAGAVDVRVFRVAVAERELGADAWFGLGAGVGYDHTAEARELVRAWSLPPGGALREREDCLPA